LNRDDLPLSIPPEPHIAPHQTTPLVLRVRQSNPAPYVTCDVRGEESHICIIQATAGTRMPLIPATLSLSTLAASHRKVCRPASWGQVLGRQLLRYFSG